MVNRHAGVFREVHRLYRLGAVGAMNDAQLLARFLARQDEGADAAFEGLVERHGSMVMRVCRSVLRDQQDAEDAFQTTFLVLARKARALWIQDSLASWLHGVAYRVASRARFEALRRRYHEREAGTRAVMEPEAIRNVPWSDDEAILSEEIARLPEKYRAPIVLCYLQSMSYQAVASRLGLSEDAVRGRLARARERLRSRLSRRGVGCAILFGASRQAIPATTIVRPALLHSTVQAVMSVSVPRLVTYEAALSLGERIGMTMMRTKLRTALLATLTLGLIATGVAVLAQPAGGRRGGPEPPAGTGKPTAHVAATNGGNLIVDWTPSGGKPEKVEITVDATRHCVHLSEVSLKRDARPNDGAIRLDLERGKTYTVAATGEAFMTDSTGPDADPFPGVVLVYSTDEEDGYAVRQTVLAAGKSITFKTPWAISPEDEVYMLAFFLDIGPNKTQRGSYKLTVTDTAQHSVRFRRDAVDLVDPQPAVGQSGKRGAAGPGAGGGIR
jgi:RNA polymerase sigma factor (sigma-70 family)